jgi:hypothetical protein
LTETERSDETKKRKDKEEKAKTREEEDGTTPAKRARTDYSSDGEALATKAGSKKKPWSSREPGSGEAPATKAGSKKKRLGSPREPGSGEAPATKAGSKKKRLGSPRGPGSGEAPATKAGSKKKPWSSPREPGSRRSSRGIGLAGQTLFELDGNKAKLAAERQVKRRKPPGYNQSICLPIDCIWPEDVDNIDPVFKHIVKTFEAEVLGFPRRVADNDLSWIMIKMGDSLVEMLKKWSKEWIADKMITWSLAQCGLDVGTTQVCGLDVVGVLIRYGLDVVGVLIVL